MGLSVETENKGCKRMWPNFAHAGWGGKQLYFTPHWSGDECKAVNWATEYNALDRDGYKKCVC